MFATQRSALPSENRVLASLPQAEYARLLPNLQRVHLAKGTVLWQAGDAVRHCYFPANGMISLLSVTEDGHTVEVTRVGNKGVAGSSAILPMNKMPFQAVVQVVADAYRIEANALRLQFKHDNVLQLILLRYTHALLCQISQSVLCNRFHTVEQRLCRSLLSTCDHTCSHVLPLSQEILAGMLGIPRTDVTMKAGALQRAGLIKYKRGQITILDPQGLETAACECYRMTRQMIDGEIEQPLHVK